MRRRTRTTNDGQMDRMGGVSTAHPPSVGRIHDVSAENHAVVDGVRSAHIRANKNNGSPWEPLNSNPAVPTE